MVDLISRRALSEKVTGFIDDKKSKEFKVFYLLTNCIIFCDTKILKFETELLKEKFFLKIETEIIKMEIVIEFAKLILPAAAVLYAMYLTIKSFLEKEMGEKLAAVRTQNASVITPIRLQAYERLCLFLERIMPNNLILRLNDSNYSYKEFQQVLIAGVREEFNHNLSQQVYVSDAVWELTRNAMEDVIITINQAAGEMSEKAQSKDLAKKIFEMQVEKKTDPVNTALAALKQEIRLNF